MTTATARRSSVASEALAALEARLVAQETHLAALEQRLVALEDEHARLRAQLGDVGDVVSGGFGRMFGLSWAPRAYSRFSRAAEPDQQRALAALAGQQVRTVFPSHLSKILGEESPA